MDTFFLILGGILVLVSIVLILRAKVQYSEVESLEDEFRDEDEMDLEIELDDEELKFIEEISDEDLGASDFEDRPAGQGLEKPEERGAVDYRDTVVIMYKAGMTANEIAKKLEMGKREVEIILKVKGLIK